MLCPIISLEHPSGLITNVLEISNRLVKKGHRVTIYTTSGSPRDYSIGKIRVREFRAFSPNHTYFLSPFLVKALLSSDEEIIHCHGYNNLITLSAMVFKKPSTKLFITLHSSGPSSSFRKLLWSIYEYAFNLFSHKIDKIVCVSEFERTEFQKKINLPTNRFVLIPNGMDYRFIQKVRSPQKKNQIISVGRLVRNKGFHHLLHSFAIVLKEFPSLKLKVVGKGIHLPELKSLASTLGISQNVIFENSIPLDDRASLIKSLKESRLFIFLSAYESQGIVVSEALSAGLPSLVSYNSGMKELVDQGFAIHINDPEDYPSVASSIISALKNPPKLKKFRPLNWDIVAKKILQLYAE